MRQVHGPDLFRIRHLGFRDDADKFDDGDNDACAVKAVSNVEDINRVHKDDDNVTNDCVDARVTSSIGGVPLAPLRVCGATEPRHSHACSHNALKHHRRHGAGDQTGDRALDDLVRSFSSAIKIQPRLSLDPDRPLPHPRPLLQTRSISLGAHSPTPPSSRLCEGGRGGGDLCNGDRAS